MDRFGSFQSSAVCHRCGKGVPVNGPLRRVQCPACRANVELDPDLIGEVLGEFDDRYSYQVGKGKDRGGRVYFRFRCEPPACESCGAELPVTTGQWEMEDTIRCECGTHCSVEPVPEWLSERVNTAVRIYNGGSEYEGDGEEVEVEDGPPLITESVACWKCETPLTVTEKSRRYVHCDACGTATEVDVKTRERIRKAVEKKSHLRKPVEGSKKWYVAYAGRRAREDRQAEEALRRMEVEEREKEEKWQRKDRTQRKWCLIVGAAALVLGSLFAFFGYRYVNWARAAVGWPTETGVITRSKVVRTRKKNKTNFRADIRFSYRVKGKPYSSDRIRLVWDTKGGRERSFGLVGKYPRGKKVTVYYDPTEPSVGCLKPGLTYGAYAFLLVGLILALGGLTVLAGIFMGRQRMMFVAIGVPVAAVVALMITFHLYGHEKQVQSPGSENVAPGPRSRPVR